MFFLKALTGLPLSLVLTTLAVVSSAAGAQLKELTPETFKDSTAKGLWFVEHFSPYCGHCRHFAPAWEKLVEEAEVEIPSVHLAQVNCAVHGDLCNANGISGYPTMFMYEEGKKVDEYKGNRDLDDLKQFLKRHVKEEVVIEEEPQPLVNLDGTLLSIDDSATFASTLAKGPAFVKFFAPWCGHCRKIAPRWVQLAAHLKNKVTVAEVDCDAHASLCAAHKVQGYPTLVYFANGVRSEYTGGRQLDQLRAFAETAAEGRLHTLGADSELQHLVEEHDVLYLVLYSDSNPDILKTAREASAPLLGVPPVYTSHSQELFIRYSVPASASWALLVFKSHDIEKPAGHLHGFSNTAPSALGPWFMTHRTPSVLELSADTFQSVMNAPQEPLVVIAAVTEGARGKVKSRVEELAREWRSKTGWTGEMNGKEVVFSFMDAERFKDWLKSMYGIKVHDDDKELDEVKVVIADHKRLVYYDEDPSGHKVKLTSTQILLSTLEKATAGKLHFKHSQNAVERLAHYLNGKLTGVEVYVTAHPFKTVLFIVGGITILFYLMFKWLGGGDVPNERDHYKSSRLD